MILKVSFLKCPNIISKLILLDHNNIGILESP